MRRLTSARRVISNRAWSPPLVELPRPRPSLPRPVRGPDDRNYFQTRLINLEPKTSSGKMADGRSVKLGHRPPGRNSSRGNGSADLTFPSSVYEHERNEAIERRLEREKGKRGANESNRRNKTG